MDEADFASETVSCNRAGSPCPVPKVGSGDMAPVLFLLRGGGLARPNSPQEPQCSAKASDRPLRPYAWACRGSAQGASSGSDLSSCSDLCKLVVHARLASCMVADLGWPHSSNMCIAFPMTRHPDGPRPVSCRSVSIGAIPGVAWPSGACNSRRKGVDRLAASSLVPQMGLSDFQWQAGVG